MKQTHPGFRYDEASHQFVPVAPPPKDNKAAPKKPAEKPEEQ
jgi:hypothetical protein